MVSISLGKEYADIPMMRITIPEFTKEESLQLREGGEKCPNCGKIFSLVQKVSKDCSDNKIFLSY